MAPAASAQAQTPTPNVVITPRYQQVVVTQGYDGYGPASSVVCAGTPIRWVVRSTAPLSCLAALRAHMVGVRATLQEGDNVFELPAQQPATIEPLRDGDVLRRDQGRPAPGPGHGPGRTGPGGGTGVVRGTPGPAARARGPDDAGMKVLVTGGAGYIGSVVAQQLLDGGYDVVVLDDLSTGHRDAVPEGAAFEEVSLLDLDATERVLAGGFDGVLHFAAKSLVGESMERPELYYRNNVCGTLNLLDAMRSQGCRRLVFSSTAATYGEPAQVPIREDAVTSPTNAYGATKLAIDAMISFECLAHGLGAASLRYFNVAGALGPRGERHAVETHLIPIVLQVALGQRDAVAVFGTDYPTPDGTAVRDYIHVQDLGRAHLLALEASRAGKHVIYNLGNGAGFSVREVVDVAREVTGHPIPARDAGRRAGDPSVLVAASDRIQQELGWQAEKTLQDMVADAWAFARSRQPAG